MVGSLNARHIVKIAISGVREKQQLSRFNKGGKGRITKSSLILKESIAKGNHLSEKTIVEGEDGRENFEFAGRNSRLRDWKFSESTNEYEYVYNEKEYGTQD